MHTLRETGAGESRRPTPSNDEVGRGRRHDLTALLARDIIERRPIEAPVHAFWAKMRRILNPT